MRFLVDSFGEEFKYEDPRISDDYIDKNNIHGQYEIVLDDDGENPAVTAIWKNEETEMKTRFNESFYGIEGAKDVDWAIIYKNCKIEPSEFYGNLGELYDEEHPEDPNHEGFDDWCWDNTDLIKSELEHLASYDDDYEGDDYYAESKKKLVKEGAGAGYDVGIYGFKIGKVTEIKEEGDYFTFTAEVEPGEYEISAEDYYNDYFRDEHEYGIKPTAVIDGGVIHGTIDIWESTDDDDEEWIKREIEGKVFDLTFGYGHGWSHANLPDRIQSDYIKTKDLYFEITDIDLDAPDLATAVNEGWENTFNDDEPEEEEPEEEEPEEDDEIMDESHDPKGDDGKKKVMDALEEFRQVLWDDTKVDDEEEHNLRRSLYQDVDNAISQAIQKYFKYSRM